MIIDQNARWGLVLSGGGALGSYQIGVWKALQELGFPSFSAISGASVGALNAALWVSGDYEKANRIWSSVTKDDFMSISGEIGRIASRDGLKTLIRNELDMKAVQECSIPVYADILPVNRREPEYIRLNGRSAKEIEDLLLASSSIPVIYGRKKVQGRHYWDGGYSLGGGDNTPIKPLYEKENIRHFVVVNLYAVFGFYDKKPYKDCTIIEIKPEQSIGSLLDFRHSSIELNKALGYYRAKQVITGRKETADQLSLLKQIVKNREDMLRLCEFSNLNVNWKINEDITPFEDVFSADGYTLQRWAEQHYRVIDDHQIRRGWWGSDRSLSAAIKKYIAVKSADIMLLGDELRQIILSEQDMERFCQLSELVNLDWNTLGGKNFWKEILTVGTYTLQQNIMFGNFRVLDGRKHRIAWWMNEHQLMDTIKRYEEES